MEDETPGLREFLQSLADDAQSQSIEHLEAEELVSYHFHKLSANEGRRIQDHLVMCRGCASDLLDLAVLCQGKKADWSEISASEPGTGWPELQALIRTASPARVLSEPEAKGTPRGILKWLRPLRPAYALAILFLVLTVSIAFWLTSLNRKNDALLTRLSEVQSARDRENVAAAKTLAAAEKELESARREVDEERKRTELREKEQGRSSRTIEGLLRPQPNAPVEDLVLGDTRSERGATAAIPLIELPEDAVRFTLVIPSSGPDLDYDNYAIEINRRGRRILTFKGLRRDTGGGFTIALTRQLFPAGEYYFRLYGLTRKGRTLVSEGAARIEYK